MTLDEMPQGAEGRVARVTGEPSLRERLTELGFTPGVTVRAERRAPLGDPIHVKVRGAGFAVRRDEAACVEVEEVQPWKPRAAS